MKKYIFCLVLFFYGFSASAFTTTPAPVSIQIETDTLPPEALTAAVAILAIPGAGEAEIAIALPIILAAIAAYGTYKAIKALAESLGEVFVVRNLRPGNKCPGKYRALYIPNANPMLIKVLDLIPGVCTEQNHLAPQDWFVVI